MCLICFDLLQNGYTFKEYISIKAILTMLRRYKQKVSQIIMGAFELIN